MLPVRSTRAYRIASELRHRIGRFTGLISFSSAAYFTLRRHPGIASVRLRPTGSIFHIRPETSDVECLRQIFIEEQYRLPFVDDPAVIVDAGANIGAASSYFAIKYPNTKIFALEPEESNFDLLKLNCAQLPNVTPIRAALWSRSEQVAITDPNASKWAFTVRETEISEPGIAGLTIDELMRRFGLDYIDLLKLDIEGAEREIFSADALDWLDRVGVIAIELHDGFKPGCAQAFYSAIHTRCFEQAVRGENIIVKMNPVNRSPEARAPIR